jgi:hypothetical protein
VPDVHFFFGGRAAGMIVERATPASALSRTTRDPHLGHPWAREPRAALFLPIIQRREQREGELK